MIPFHKLISIFFGTGMVQLLTFYKGGGGGGIYAYPGATESGGAGGSGIVVIKEPSVDFTEASSVWDLRTVFRLVKAGDWTN